jgi:hypothetical protein
MEEKRIYYVYKHYLEDPDKPFYIGYGSNRRCKVYRTSQKHWVEYIKDKKWNYSIIEDNLTYEEASELEIKYIKLYGRMDKYEWGILINKTDGGKGSKGIICSEEKKKKLSEIQKSKNIKGESHPMYGKHHTQEAKNAVSIANKGRNIGKFKNPNKVMNCKTCNIRLSYSNKSGYCKEHYRTEEYRIKLSKSLKGKKKNNSVK